MNEYTSLNRFITIIIILLISLFSIVIFTQINYLLTHSFEFSNTFYEPFILSFFCYFLFALLKDTKNLTAIMKKYQITRYKIVKVIYF